MLGEVYGDGISDLLVDGGLGAGEFPVIGEGLNPCVFTGGEGASLVWVAAFGLFLCGGAGEGEAGLVPAHSAGDASFAAAEVVAFHHVFLLHRFW